MKNFYTFSIVALAFSFNLNAQLIFEDDFESYDLGVRIGCQNPTVWDCVFTSLGIMVVDDFAASGVQSGNIPPDGVTDAILLLGNRTFGIYNLRFYVYVPSGATGYWNIQQEEIPGVQWNGQWYVDATGAGGSAGVITYDITGATIPYPNDKWFEIFYEIDLDFVEISMWVDGALFLEAEPYVGTWLGALNFYSIDGNTDFFIDDIYYIGNTFAVDDFSADVFSVYPNPVSNTLFISSENTLIKSLSVYSVLGEKVIKVNTNEFNSLDVSSLSEGLYFLKITTSEGKSIQKFIKK